MNVKIKTPLFIVIRIMVGLFFITSALLKLYPIEYLELNIAETGITGWTLVTFASRLLIGFELLIGVFLIFKALYRATLLASLVSLIGFCIYLGYLMIFRKEITNCGCMGLEVSITPVQSLIKNIVLIFLSILLYLDFRKYETEKSSKLKSYATTFLLIASLVLPFILNPIGAYPKDKNPEIKTVNLNSHSFHYGSSQKKITEEKKMICFFSYQCKFCKLSARKLKTIIRKNKVELPLYFVFMSDSSNVKEINGFLTETDLLDIAWIYLPPEEFFKTGGNSLPAIYSVIGDSIVWKDNFLTLEEDDILKFFEIKK